MLRNLLAVIRWTNRGGQVTPTAPHPDLAGARLLVFPPMRTSSAAAVPIGRPLMRPAWKLVRCRITQVEGLTQWPRGRSQRGASRPWLASASHRLP